MEYAFGGHLNQGFVPLFTTRNVRPIPELRVGFDGWNLGRERQLCQHSSPASITAIRAVTVGELRRNTSLCPTENICGTLSISGNGVEIMDIVTATYLTAVAALIASLAKLVWAFRRRS